MDPQVVRWSLTDVSNLEVGQLLAYLVPMCPLLFPSNHLRAVSSGQFLWTGKTMQKYSDRYFDDHHNLVLGVTPIPFDLESQLMHLLHHLTQVIFRPPNTKF